MTEAPEKKDGEGKRDAKPVPTVSRCLPNGALVELLYDPVRRATALAHYREGRWTIEAAIDEGVPAPVLTTALYERFSSRNQALFADKICSAMRYEFGGHHEKPAE